MNAAVNIGIGGADRGTGYPARRRSRFGLSIVEVMISLTIAAMLLTAVAAAFSASSDVIDHNDQFFRACQAARVSMNQMLTQIRRADVVGPVSTSSLTLTTIPVNPADPNSGIQYTYAFDSVNQRIMLKTDDDATDPDYKLAMNVTQCKFDSQTETQAGVPHIVRVTITLTVQVGENVIRLSGSAAPRRSQNYNL